MKNVFAYFKQNKFIWFLAFLFSLLYIIENINGRFWLNDFKVYYMATKNFIAGKQVYGEAFGLSSGLYKYSPFALLFFVPFTFLPYFLASTLFFALISGVIIYTMLFLERFLSEYFFPKKDVLSNKVLFLSMLILLMHYHRELHLGNVNFLLLAVLLMSLGYILKNREYLAGVCIGAAILFKPHFIVLMPLLLIRRRFKTFITILTAIVAGLLLPGLLIGFGKNQDLLVSWFTTMKSHNAISRLIENPNTLQAWLYRAGFNIIFPEVSDWYSNAIILLVAGLFLFFILRNLRVEQQIEIHKNELAGQNFISEYLILIALIPNITFTDTEHFLLSLPLIMFLLLFMIFRNQSRNSLLFYISIGAFFFYGGNWHDLWGNTISGWMEKTGLLGLGNMFIIAISVYVFITNQKLVTKVAEKAA